MTKPSPTFAQMDNWLDAKVQELAKSKEDKTSRAYRCGIVTALLSMCLDRPAKLDELRAEILSFPEERQ